MTEITDRIRRLLPLAVVLAIVSAVAVYQLPYYFMSDKEKVAHAVHEIVEAARQRRVQTLMQYVAEDYSDHTGQDRETLDKRLKYMWFTFKEVRVNLLEEPEVTLSPDTPDTAIAHLRAKVLLGRERGKEPTNDMVGRYRGTDRFELEFKKRDGEWRVVECRDPARTK